MLNFEGIPVRPCNDSRDCVSNLLIIYEPVIAAQIQGTTQDHLQIFNIEAKQKIKSYQMPEQVSLLVQSDSSSLC
jgi:hypothetical protein